MAVAVKVTFRGEGATLEKYGEALEAMGTSPGGKHPDSACMFHWATQTDDGFRVTDVWESKEAFEAFARDKIVPVTSGLGIPEPEIKYVEVASYLT